MGQAGTKPMATKTKRLVLDPRRVRIVYDDDGVTIRTEYHNLRSDTWKPCTVKEIHIEIEDDGKNG